MSELESGHCYEMEGSNIPASIFDCNQWLQGGGNPSNSPVSILKVIHYQHPVSCSNSLAVKLN